MTYCYLGNSTKCSSPTPPHLSLSLFLSPPSIFPASFLAQLGPLRHPPAILLLFRFLFFSFFFFACATLSLPFLVRCTLCSTAGPPVCSEVRSGLQAPRGKNNPRVFADARASQSLRPLDQLDHSCISIENHAETGARIPEFSRTAQTTRSSFVDLHQPRVFASKYVDVTSCTSYVCKIYIFLSLTMNPPDSRRTVPFSVCK